MYIRQFIATARAGIVTPVIVECQVTTNRTDDGQSTYIRSIPRTPRTPETPNHNRLNIPPHTISPMTAPPINAFFMSCLLSDLDAELFQLRFTHRGRCVHHQVHGLGSFWEGDDFAQAGGAGEDHHNAIQAERNAAMRRRAILQRLEEKSKACAGFFFGHAQGTKNFSLDILAVNTNRA